jgi:ketosteroid isomerase-like protein
VVEPHPAKARPREDRGSLTPSVATGRPYGNHYISVVTIKDRKIIHWRDYLDPLRVFEALGVNDS